MKKNFITRVLLMALIAFGLTTFNSCKDTDEDFVNQLESEQVNLKAALEELAKQCEVCKADCDAQIKDLEDKLKQHEQYNNLTFAEVYQLIETLTKTKADQTSVDNIIKIIYGEDGNGGLMARISALESLQHYNFSQAELDGIKFLGENKDKLAQLLELNQYISDLKKLAALTTQIEGLFGDNGTIADINNSITNINTNITTINNSITDIKKVLYGDGGEDKGLISKVDTLISDYTTLNGKVEGLEKWFQKEDGTNAWSTVAEFQNLVNQGQFIIDNKVALDYLIGLKDKLNGDALDALNKVYQDLEGIDGMYTAIFKDAQLPEGEAAWWNYGQVMQNIKDNTAAIQALQEKVDVLFQRFNDLVTGLILQASLNPVYGSFNTPFGINSLVLMACYGERATSANVFPISGVSAECYSADNDDINWDNIISGEKYQVGKYIVNTNEAGEAHLGSFWFTVNPGTVNKLDLDGFALVNSREDEPVVKVNNVYKDDETLFKFGLNSRAAGNGNGLYCATASVPVQNLQDIKVNVEPGLVEALKDAVKNHTASDMVQMLKKVYAQLHDVCDANALRYVYNAPTGAQNADGSWIMAQQKVYSNYGMAATAFKPLSFATLKGSSFDKIPTISPIEISKDMVNLKLEPFIIDSKNFSLELNFGEPYFDPLNPADLIVKTTVKAELTSEDGQKVTGNIPVEINISDQAQKIQDNFTSAIDGWLNKDGETIDERVEKAIWYALFNDKNNADPNPYDPSKPEGVVADLTSQVNKMMGDIQDKLYDLIDQINSDYLGKVNSLVNRYNSVAERINKVLSNPNHYLQSVMLYKKADGNLGLLSTNPKQPTQFRGNGEAISLWATTYNFETVAPAFKKIVGVVKVTNGSTSKPELAKKANATMAQVLDGARNRVALDVRGAANGDVYEIAYQALDYTGHTSTVKCYVQILK